jgi:hypothetical protein
MEPRSSVSPGAISSIRHVLQGAIWNPRKLVLQKCREFSFLGNPVSSWCRRAEAAIKKCVCRTITLGVYVAEFQCVQRNKEGEHLPSTIIINCSRKRNSLSTKKKLFKDVITLLKRSIESIWITSFLRHSASTGSRRCLLLFCTIFSHKVATTVLWRN